VNKQAPTIHYHEFIAACLNQCAVDERNLRLAFDRMDNEHKGFITVDNIIDMLGCDATEENVRAMFDEAQQKCVNSHAAQISYPDFVRLMKGQNADMVAPSLKVVDVDE
jgi:calcium-dependent protein kinase